jgi:Glycosyl transferase family 2
MEGRNASAKRPAVSVIVVSDHAAGGEPAWNEFRRVVRAWAEQDYEGCVEFVIVESSRHEEQMPEDLRRLAPPFRILHFDADTSDELKNRAAASVESDIVAVVDADCVPRGNWLRLMMAALAEHADIAAVSGRTMYPGTTLVERILCLLLRGYLDPGRRGLTRYICHNAAGFRRDVLDTHPLPEGLGAFASQLQSEAMARDGYKFFFEPGMTVTHEYEGWAMERDLRRNHGYGTVITRLTDERLPYAKLVRMGVPAIPLITLGKAIDSFLTCIRCWPYYNVHWYELPVAFVMIVVTHAMEIPGMLAAYRGVPNSSLFR